MKISLSFYHVSNASHVLGELLFPQLIELRYRTKYHFEESISDFAIFELSKIHKQSSKVNESYSKFNVLSNRCTIFRNTLALITMNEVFKI